MTNQEAFDKMVAHLRTLSERSMDDSTSNCLYNGSKCAVGALMSDDEQTRFGDSLDAVGDLLLVMTHCGHTSALHGLSLPMLRAMQVIHDADNNWSDEGFVGEPLVADVARKRGLVYTPPVGAVQ